MKKTKRFIQLNEQEKHLIYTDWRSGRFYQKEICETYRITAFTLGKVVEEAKTILGGENE